MDSLLAVLVYFCALLLEVSDWLGMTLTFLGTFNKFWSSCMSFQGNE